jgi:peptidoglycan-associated lipoprotein
MSNTNASVIIEGHCDWKGTTEYNISLGERRATVVKQFLMAMGIQAKRISVNSQGDLLSTENGEGSAMAKDRKARFIVVQG